MTTEEPLRVPARLRSRFDEIAARTDGFAKEHLNEEYAVLCRRMAAALARKRPSPLEGGEVRTWAAGIVYAAGWVNFLADPSQEPHLTTAELARRAGVGESTIALRFRAIRQALDLARMEPEWTLPSKLEDNPFAWLLLVDGIPIDARHAPRELQEEALRLGLIPYIPADGPAEDEPPRAPGAQAAGGKTPKQPRPGDREAGSRPGRGAEAGEGRVYQLEITLREIRPTIRRRVLVPEDTTLIGLHRVIQAAVGWEDYHLWRFAVGGVEYHAAAEEGHARGVRARTARLNQVAHRGDVLLYEYDFGDSWEHRVRVEKVLPAEPGRAYPVCIAAERAGPPEDCGGVWGYQRLLEVLANPALPEYHEMLEWLGGPFDPEEVDLGEINERLALTRPTESEGGWAAEMDGEAAGPPSLGQLAELVAGEAGDVLRRLMAQNPDATLDELNAELDVVSAQYNTRPQPALGGLSPEQADRLLHEDPEWLRGSVHLDHTLSLAELEGSRTLHDARLFLALLDERGEVKATPKGNLPRALVADLHAGMRRSPWDGGHRLEERKLVNEENVLPLHFLRILLDLGGLIKRRKGMFSLTRSGERLLAEERAGLLQATLFRTHFRRVNLALLGGAEAAGFQHTVAFPLFRFGQLGADWSTPAELKTELVLPSIRRELLPDAYHDPLEFVVEHQLLRPLEGFGLAEAQPLPREPGTWRQEVRYRKSALFGRFLRFAV